MRSTTVQHSFNAAANTYEHAAQLQKRVAHYLNDHLQDAQLQAETILELGAGTGFLSNQLISRYPNSKLIITDCAEGMLHINKNKCYAQQHLSCFGEHLPFATQSIDLIVSNLMLQWCTIKDVFQEARRVLKRQGHFIATTLGERTLEELKLCYQKIGITNGINTFLSTNELLEVARQQLLTVQCMKSQLFIDYHPSCLDLLKNLKRIGSLPSEPSYKGLLTMRQLKALESHYTQPRQHNGIGAVYDVILLHLTKD